jgi:tight adherence protein C
VELAIIAGFAVFLLIMSTGLLLFHRAPAAAQIATTLVIAGESRRRKRSVKLAVASLGRLVERFDGVVSQGKTASKSSATRQRLVSAGYRSDAAVRIFSGAQTLVALGLPILTLITGLAQQNYLVVLPCAGVIGYMLPDFWLGRMVAARQKRIRLALPDVLDLLIVCVEAGLGLDQATSRTAEELGKSDSPIADELNVVVLELRAGCSRADAWRNLSERTGVPSVRNVVSTLVQAEQFGTSIAKTLRVYSETMRTQRTQQAEEIAAKTGIKMLIPLVLFIFPAIFVVTLGPAIIGMIDTFSKQH